MNKNPVPKLEMGKKYRDPVSGFEGICSATYLYITGCVRYELVGKSKDGAEAPSMVFDEGQIELVEGETVEPQAQRETGGPQRSAPIGRRSPGR
jgi:hypothetical protein